MAINAILTDLRDTLCDAFVDYIDSGTGAGYIEIGTTSDYPTTGTKLFEGSVSTSGADINFDSVSFSEGTTISISSGTITMPAS